MTNFTSSDITNMSNSDVAQLSAVDISNMPVQVWESFSPDQLSHITLDAMAGLTGAHIVSLGASPEMIGVFTPEQISHLNAPEYPDGTHDYSLLQSFMNHLSLHPETVQDFTSSDMALFTPEAVNWFPSGFVGDLPPETFSGFTADQISQLNPGYFHGSWLNHGDGVSPDQLSHITLDAMAGLTGAHIVSLGASPEMITAFSHSQLLALEPSSYDAFEAAWETAAVNFQMVSFDDYIQMLSDGSVTDSNIYVEQTEDEIEQEITSQTPVDEFDEEAPASVEDISTEVQDEEFSQPEDGVDAEEQEDADVESNVGDGAIGAEEESSSDGINSDQAAGHPDWDSALTNVKEEREPREREEREPREREEREPREIEGHEPREESPSMTLGNDRDEQSSWVRSEYDGEIERAIEDVKNPATAEKEFSGGRDGRSNHSDKEQSNDSSKIDQIISAIDKNIVQNIAEATESYPSKNDEANLSYEEEVPRGREDEF